MFRICFWIVCFVFVLEDVHGFQNTDKQNTERDELDEVFGYKTQKSKDKEVFSSHKIALLLKDAAYGFFHNIKRFMRIKGLDFGEFPYERNSDAQADTLQSSNKEIFHTLDDIDDDCSQFTKVDDEGRKSKEGLFRESDRKYLDQNNQEQILSSLDEKQKDSKASNSTSNDNIGTLKSKEAEKTQNKEKLPTSSTFGDSVATQKTTKEFLGLKTVNDNDESSKKENLECNDGNNKTKTAFSTITDADRIICKEYRNTVDSSSNTAFEHNSLSRTPKRNKNILSNENNGNIFHALVHLPKPYEFTSANDTSDDLESLTSTEITDVEMHTDMTPVIQSPRLTTQLCLPFNVTDTLKLGNYHVRYDKNGNKYKLLFTQPSEVQGSWTHTGAQTKEKHDDNIRKTLEIQQQKYNSKKSHESDEIEASRNLKTLSSSHSSKALIDQDKNHAKRVKHHKKLQRSKNSGFDPSIIETEDPGQYLMSNEKMSFVEQLLEKRAVSPLNIFKNFNISNHGSNLNSESQINEKPTRHEINNSTTRDENMHLGQGSNKNFDEPRCVNHRIVLGNGEFAGSCYTSGAVTTEVPLCSRLGADVLLDGGNAVDAAVAATICVGIINSFSSGIGGGGFLLIAHPERKFAETYDFRETAPENISPELFNAPDLSKKGGLAVGVPGEVAGLYAVHKKHGKMPWAALFTRNIEIAKRFEVSEQLAKRLDKLKDHIYADPGLRAVYTSEGKIVSAGAFISRENYARTLSMIAQDPNDFYEGKIAQALIDTIRKQGGVITKKDLLKYKTLQRPPLQSNFRGYDVLTTNLPTSGLFLIEALNILEHFDLKDLERIGHLNPSLPEFPHFQLLIEIFKFIGAKRGKGADPAFLENAQRVISEITDPKNAEDIAKKIDLNYTLPDSAYGAEPTKDDHGTTHINVIDSDGLVVALTSTVNLEFGAKFMCETTGIILNNQIDDFYVPNVKNAFDLGAMPTNIVAPGKRPFSSAAPIILSKPNELLVIGAAGGTRIPTSILTTIFYLILGKTIEEAIDAPRIHNQFIPHTTYIENTFDQHIADYLRLKGHRLEVSAINSIFTSVQGIHVIINADGEKIIQAASDQRKGGSPSGN